MHLVIISKMLHLSMYLGYQQLHACKDFMMPMCFIPFECEINLN